MLFNALCLQCSLCTTEFTQAAKRKMIVHTLRLRSLTHYVNAKIQGDLRVASVATLQPSNSQSINS